MPADQKEQAFVASGETLIARLAQAARVLIGRVLEFDEWQQELFCPICRLRDEFSLHEDDCPVYALHTLCDEVEIRSSPREGAVILTPPPIEEKDELRGGRLGDS
jgi:hypothetical protein